MVGLHDVTNSIILFSLPVSQLTKGLTKSNESEFFKLGERVGNVDVRQTRKIRNQIRRYSPPLAPQNGVYVSIFLSVYISFIFFKIRKEKNGVLVRMRNQLLLRLVILRVFLLLVKLRTLLQEVS